MSTVTGRDDDQRADVAQRQPAHPAAARGALGGPAAAELADVTALSYREASQELDAIVALFEASEVDVDQLVQQLKRATALVDELDRRIRATGAQVEELVPRLASFSRGDAGAVEDARPQ